MTQLLLVMSIGSLMSAGPYHPGTLGHFEAKKPEMVYVPSGEFLMGHNPPGVDWGAIRRVALDAYWISKNDVTISQFGDYCEATGYKFDWDGRRPAWGWEKDDRPMVDVTWEEARAYCKWAGGDLPTEAQWEKAARGTDGRNYPWGNEFATNRSWYKEGNDSAAEPAPVGSFPKGASPWGCLDMAGNVGQWCRDYFGDPDATDRKNPTGPGFGSKRVVRGGSLVDRRQLIISWVRNSADPMVGNPWIGFRMVKNRSSEEGNLR